MFKIRRSNSAFNKLNSSDSYIKAEQKLTKNIPSVDHQLDLIWTILDGLNKRNCWIMKWNFSCGQVLHVTSYTLHQKFIISLFHLASLTYICRRCWNIFFVFILTEVGLPWATTEWTDPPPRRGHRQPLTHRQPPRPEACHRDTGPSHLLCQKDLQVLDM